MSVCIGLVHEDLQVFLESNLPSGKKAKKVVLGVCDSKLGGSIQEVMGVKCESGGSVLEVTRGIRLYFTKLVKGQLLLLCIAFTVGSKLPNLNPSVLQFFLVIRKHP